MGFKEEIATAGLGIGTSIANGVGNLIFGEFNQRQQLRGQKKALQQSNEAQLDLWNKTNYGAQMKHIKEAGLNPGLIYGMGGAGGSTGSGGANVQGGQASMDVGMGLQNMMMLKKLESEIKNIDADTEQKKGATALSGAQKNGVVINNAIQDFVLMEKHADYLDYYAPVEEVDEEGNVWITGNNPNREARVQTNMKELESRKAVAENIVEQWKNGNLQKMSQAQLDNMLKDLGVKEGTITKLDIENKLNKMELVLMEKLGIGKDAKSWIEGGANMILNLIKLAMIKQGRK